MKKRNKVSQPVRRKRTRLSRARSRGSKNKTGSRKKNWTVEKFVDSVWRVMKKQERSDKDIRELHKRLEEALKCPKNQR